MDTTEMEKLRILTMWECGKSTAEIAAAVKKSKRTVQRWLALQKKQGNMARRARGLRPRKTTAEEDERIVRLATENPGLTQKEVLTLAKVNIYKGTLRRRLQEAKGIYKIDLFAEPKSRDIPKTKAPYSKKRRKQLEEAPQFKEEMLPLPEEAHTYPVLSSLLTDGVDGVNVVAVEGINCDNEHTAAVTMDASDIQIEYCNSEDASDYVDGGYGEHEVEVETFYVTPEEDVLSTHKIFNNLIGNVKVEVIEGQHTMVDVDEQMTQETTLQMLMAADINEDNVQMDIVKAIDQVDQATFSLDNETVQESIPNDITDQIFKTDPIIYYDKQFSIEAIPRKGRRIKCESNVTNSMKKEIDIEDANLKQNQKCQESVQENGESKSTDKKSKVRKMEKAKRAQRRSKKELVFWNPNRKDTTETEKNKILIMMDCGKSTEEIAFALKKSTRTVQRWLKRYHQGMDMTRKERGKRPRKTTPEEDARIVEVIKGNPRMARRDVLRLANINLNKATITRRLNEAGIFFNNCGHKILDYSDEVNPRITRSMSARNELVTVDDDNLITSEEANLMAGVMLPTELYDDCESLVTYSTITVPPPPLTSAGIDPNAPSLITNTCILEVTPMTDDGLNQEIIIENPGIPADLVVTHSEAMNFVVTTTSVLHGDHDCSLADDGTAMV